MPGGVAAARQHHASRRLKSGPDICPVRIAVGTTIRTTRAKAARWPGFSVPAGGLPCRDARKSTRIPEFRIKTPGLLEIPLASIEVGTDRARDLEPAWAEALAKLIDAQGLLHPIIVRPMDGMPDRYRLVAGLHRLEGVRLNGGATIAAFLSSAGSDDDARLEEVMENLGRYDLNALDRCHHLYELKQIHERKYPQAKHGGDRKSDAIKIHTVDLETERPEIFGFSAYASEKIGLSRSAISKAVAIWTGLTPASRRRLGGTALAGKQTELKSLSEEGPSRQERILNLILGDDHPDIHNVAAALAHLDRGVAISPVEKQAEAVKTAFPNLGAGLWILHRNTGTTGLGLGYVTLSPGTVVRAYQDGSSTLISSQTPTYTGGDAGLTVFYAFYAMGSWG